jgi:hypothetical protein
MGKEDLKTRSIVNSIQMKQKIERAAGTGRDIKKIFLCFLI